MTLPTLSKTALDILDSMDSLLLDSSYDDIEHHHPYDYYEEEEEGKDYRHRHRHRYGRGHEYEHEHGNGNGHEHEHHHNHCIVDMDNSFDLDVELNKMNQVNHHHHHQDINNATDLVLDMDTERDTDTDMDKNERERELEQEEPASVSAPVMDLLTPPRHHHHTTHANAMRKMRQKMALSSPSSLTQATTPTTLTSSSSSSDNDRTCTSHEDHHHDDIEDKEDVDLDVDVNDCMVAIQLHRSESTESDDSSSSPSPSPPLNGNGNGGGNGNGKGDVTSSSSSPLSSGRDHPNNQDKEHGNSRSRTTNTYKYHHRKQRQKQKQLQLQQQPMIYTCPERRRYNNDPSGMVIHASSTSNQNPNQAQHQHQIPDDQYQYAEEAILDPTWLDSDEEEEEEQQQEQEDEMMNSASASPSAPASVLASSSLEFHPDAASNASSSYVSQSCWSLGTGSSISVGSCGFGKISISGDISIASSITSSIGSDSAFGNAAKKNHEGGKDTMMIGSGSGRHSGIGSRGHGQHRHHGHAHGHHHGGYRGGNNNYHNGQDQRDIRVHSARNGRGGKKLILSQVDIVDMGPGVDSVMSQNSRGGSSSALSSHCSSSCSDLFALDYLYDLDRKDYDLSEDEEGEGEDDIVDGKATDRYIRAINAASVIGGHQSEFEIYSSEEEVYEDEQGAIWTTSNHYGDDDEFVDCNHDYLPHCLVTPPKVRRQRGPADGDSDDSEDGESDGHDPSLKTCISAVSIFKDSTDAAEGTTIVASDQHTSEVPTPKSTAVQIPSPPSEEDESTLDAVVVTHDFPATKLQFVPALVSDDIGTGEEVNDVAISKLTAQQDMFDDESASSSDETNICSNCSPSNPTNLNGSQVGIISGDLVLSILDCPGSRTRKKRALRKGRQTNEGFQWGDHAVTEAISRMRSLRKNACEITPGELYSSSLAPEKTGRILSCEITIDSPSASNYSERRGMNVVVSNLRTPISSPMESPSSSKSLLLGKFRIFGHSVPSPHRSQRLENIALEHLKNDDFENALPIYRQILRIYRDQVELCQKYGEKTDEFHTCVGMTLYNIGIVYMCKAEYSKALEFLEKASRKIAAYGSLEDCIDIAIMRGHANYAMEEFHIAERHWYSAVNRLRKTKMPHNEVISEILNNLGCVYFEIGSEAKALKFLKESLQVRKKEIMASVFDRNELLYQHTLVKLAATRANIGYITLRLKQADLAISSFEESLLDLDVCLDSYHNLVSGTMDYLAMAHLRAGKRDDAINIYSKMLTAKIEAEGPEHVECVAILTKISLLQVKGKDKAGVRSILKKIQQCVRENGQCQKERLERILKISKVSGLKPITARGAGHEKYK